MNLRSFDPYLATIITSYIITFGVYIYYGIQYDKKRGVIPKYEKIIYTMSMLCLIAIPYFGCLYSIIDNSLTDNYIQFIILNTIIVSCFIIIIIMKDTIINNFGYDSVIFTNKRDWLDTKEYDQKLNKMIDIKDENKLNIRKKAAESEYTERVFLEEGIYE